MPSSLDFDPGFGGWNEVDVLRGSVHEVVVGHGEALKLVTVKLGQDVLLVGIRWGWFDVHAFETVFKILCLTGIGLNG